MESRVREELAHLHDVPLLLQATVPCLSMTVADLLTLDAGSILSTDRAAGESVDINVGGKPLGQGELIVIENILAARLSDFGERI